MPTSLRLLLYPTLILTYIPGFDDSFFLLILILLLFSAPLNAIKLNHPRKLLRAKFRVSYDILQVKRMQNLVTTQIKVRAS
jgi:hypothetical protein